MPTETEVEVRTAQSSSSISRRNWLVPAGVVALLFCMVLQLALTADRTSLFWDEADHIYAGYMTWKTGDYGLNPEHPPLVKLLGTLPLVPMRVTLPPLQQRNFKVEAFLGGKDFLFNNDANAMAIRVRMAVMLLTVGLALLVFFAAREMFGLGAGFIALGLLAFDPNLVAHGALLGTDIGLSCFMLATIYAFYRYVKKPSIGRMLVVGLALGLAFAAKHTAILLVPMLLMLAAVEVIRNEQGESRKKMALRFTGTAITVAVLSVAILWSFYGFRYAARPNGMQLNPTLPEFVNQLSRPHEAKLISAVARLKLLPESYLYGLTDVRIMSDFYQSFLLGKTYTHGVASYFPIAFSIKSTLTFLSLLVLAIVAIATRKLTKWREILFLTIPPVFYLFVAIYSRMNIGLRHILPMYAFLWVLVAGAAWTFVRRDRRWLYAVIALIGFQAVSSVRTFPAYMGYANELWGGPTQTYKYLSDSNADWAQQLKSVKKYLDARGIKDCWFIYFAEGVLDTKYYGIPCKPLPTADSFWIGEKIPTPPSVDGIVLMSAGDWSGFEYGAGALNPYEHFKQLKPVALIDYGVLVYEGHFDIPLAAAKTHVQSAREFMQKNDYASALSEAEQAAKLAPNDARSNAAYGDALAKLGRTAEARAAYEKALQLARTIEPEFQAGTAEDVEGKLKEMK